jgi:hypothetical protein
MDGSTDNATATLPVLAAAAPADTTLPFEPVEADVPTKERRHRLLAAALLVAVVLGGLIAALGLWGGGSHLPTGRQQLTPASSGAAVTSRPPTRRTNAPGPSTVRTTQPAAVTTGPAQPVQTTPAPAPTTGGPAPSQAASG